MPWFEEVSLWAAAQSPVLVTLIGTGLGAALITGLTAYFVARRGTSGSAAKSDAATLFQALDSFRKDQTALILRQDERIQRQDGIIASQGATISSQEDQIQDLTRKVAVLETSAREHRNCKERIAVLEDEVNRLERQVGENP